MLYSLIDYLNKIMPEIDWTLERTTDNKFGDFSSNVAFKLSKERKKPPMAIADDLVAEIKTKDTEKIFDDIEAATPGFINFKVAKSVFIKYLANIPDFNLKSLSPRNNAKINLEFVSANPTGPLTMANGRGGFLGDVLGRVLKLSGFDVTKEYYVNDAGVQIKKLGGSILAALGLVEKSPEHYQGAYVADLAKKLKVKITKKIKKGVSKPVFSESELEDAGRLAAKELLASIKKSIKNVGIEYDVWFSEYDELRKNGMLDKTLKLLRDRDMVYERDGAVWLRTMSSAPTAGMNDVADDKDRVLIKSDGEATYFLADLAYHYNKFIERGFDKAIVIWGADHHGYVGRVKSGIEAMGINSNNFEAIIVQLIRLVKSGKEVKMSKRKGDFVTLDDLVKEVGKDAVRFFFLLHTPTTHMDFDLDLAKEKSVKNPVYYAQYAYVRALAIIKKTKKYKNTKINGQENANSLSILNSESEWNLIKEMTKLSEMIKQTAKDYEVSRLVRYSMDLARYFHNFYEKERVIVDDKSMMTARLALIDSFVSVFESLFDILGVTKIKKM